MRTHPRIYWPFWIGIAWGMFIIVLFRVSPEQMMDNIKAWRALL